MPNRHDALLRRSKRKPPDAIDWPPPPVQRTRRLLLLLIVSSLILLAKATALRLITFSFVTRDPYNCFASRFCRVDVGAEKYMVERELERRMLCSTTYVGLRT